MAVDLQSAARRHARGGASPVHQSFTFIVNPALTAIRISIYAEPPPGCVLRVTAGNDDRLTALDAAVFRPTGAEKKLPTSLKTTLIVNGSPQTISVEDETEDLLYVLRDKLSLKGPRFGCGAAQCGCCTVIINGAITRSCITPMTEVPAGAAITTLDGIGDESKPHPLQQAFIDEQAGQCAYCCNSMIMGAYGWLEGRIAGGNTAVPTDQEIKDFLSGNGTTPPYDYLCRCGAHLRIIAAIQSAAKVMVGGGR